MARRNNRYPLSLDEHRRVGLTLSAMRSMFFSIATGEWLGRERVRGVGGSFRWSKTTTPASSSRTDRRDLETYDGPQE